MASHSDAEGTAMHRPWVGLHMKALNVEKGAKRFSPAGDSVAPRTATWRNNLVALSQRRNLLFMAYLQQIYVWVPRGSFQVLGSKPEMIINPAMKNPQSPGYIAPGFPHAVNSLLVDDLGREEVLLLATDSGNVCAYRVEAIWSALVRAAKSNQTRPLDDSQVDPFFVEFVEASAWGLAIHKYARLIAVTANTGLITVFAFALVNPTSEKSRNSGDPLEGNDDFSDCDQTWLEIKNDAQFSQLRQFMPENYRTRNIKLTYTGHFTNIPSVSFLNCDLDPNGAWMVSTDIDNKLLVWKVWEGLAPLHLYHFNSFSFQSFTHSLQNDTERGWAVIALDPRSFHRVKTREDACGGVPRRHTEEGLRVLDLTRLSSKVPNASQLYNYFPPAVKLEPEQPVLPDIFDQDCRISAGKRSYAKHDSINNDSTYADEKNASNGTTLEDTNNPAVVENLRPIGVTDSFSFRAVDDSLPEGDTSQDSDSDIDIDLDAEPERDARDSGMQQTPRANVPSIPRPAGNGPLNTAEFLRFALFEALGGELPVAEGYYDDRDVDYPGYNDVDDNRSHGSESRETESSLAYEVFDRMLRDAFPDDSSPYDFDGPTERLMPLQSVPALTVREFPIIHFSQTDIRLIRHPLASVPSVVCGAPLGQPFTHPIVSIRASDRFNMVKYIPEHGIIVAASQKGRAAVISLTESEETGVAFRVDWIVPFESQEQYGDRPLIPLLGMSVSPIQGFEIPPDVPYIPRDVSESDEITFHYKFHPHDGADNPPSKDAFHRDQIEPPEWFYDLEPDSNDPGNKHVPPLTLPECHAKASRAYKPDESWRGWYPSRRYRLLLMYADHTVMSYEFWYDGRSPGWDQATEDECLVP